MSHLLVVGGIWVRQGRLLLVQRALGGSLPGLWELPGGKVEGGEGPSAALAREWKEELDLTVGAVEPYAFEVEERAQGPLTLLFFKLTAVWGTPRLLHGQGLRWCGSDEALLLATPPPDAPVIRRLAAEGGGRFLDTGRGDAAEVRRLAEETEPFLHGSESLAPGGVLRFRKRAGPHAPAVDGILLLTHDGPRAYRNVCPHVPVPLDRPDEDLLTRDGKFLVCARHGALFVPENGLCVAGPCEGESLTPLPLAADGAGFSVRLP